MIVGDDHQINVVHVGAYVTSAISQCTSLTRWV